MSEDLNVYTAVEAAVDVYRAVDDEATQQGVALLLGKLMLPDVDAEAREFIAVLVIKGALASW